MAKILNGRKIRDQIAEKLKGKISRHKIKPCIAIIQVGNLAESNAYIHQKKLFAEKIGARVVHLKLSNSISEKNLISQIKNLNKNKKIHGIIAQMPIPERLNKEKIIESINPIKDVDGLHSTNLKKLWEGKKDGYIPATAKGVLSMIDFYKILLESKRVLVIGRSGLVGKPLSLLFLNRNATVTIAHSKTKNLALVCREADIIVAAAGVPNLIRAKDIKSGQTVIDVGINVLYGRLKKKKLENEITAPKLIGDVDFQAVSKIVKAISPVPGGAGPMTVASLFENLLDAYNRQNVKIK